MSERSPPFRLPFCVAFAAFGPAVACDYEPSPPLAPTWADVQPILEGQCNHCHGSNAASAGSDGVNAYRFDFYEMSRDICGDAAAAMGPITLAKGRASLIGGSITVPSTGGRSRMPPAPAELLPRWQRDTILRWVANPQKGDTPKGNHPPRLRINGLPANASNRISFVAVADDPDFQSVVGVVKAGEATFPLDRPGSFTVELDTKSAPAGPLPITATLCDGWVISTFDLGTVLIAR